MNKLLVNLICLFITKKKNRKHFREKYETKVNEKKQITELLLNLNKLLIEKEREVYDFIIPLGVDCRCSTILKHLNLQNESTPLDTFHNFNEVSPFLHYEKISGYMGFESKMELIINNFTNFLNLEDLEVCYYPYNTNQHYVCGNKKLGLFYYHEFNCNTFDEARNINANTYILTSSIINNLYEATKEKYLPRIERFYNKIEHSKKILFVYIEEIERIDKIYKHLEKDIIIKKQQEIAKYYPDKQIDFIFFQHDNRRRENEIERFYLNNNILIVNSNHSIIENSFVKNNASIKIAKTIYNTLNHLKLNDRLFY